MSAAPPLLDELHRLIDRAGTRLAVRVLGEVPLDARTRLPLYALALGGTAPALPAIGVFGGVHGLERIGAEVVLAYLAHLVNRLDWDEALHAQLERQRLVFMPIVNPGGLSRGTRANPNGVDLMRNAPVDAREPVPFLIGGQRVGPHLPWYRGASGAAMETESAALCALVEQELLARPFSLAIDCHSGFGLDDRLWFPYAHTREPLPDLAELHALHEVFARTMNHHRYVFEPQSRQYLTHGDLWDHLYLRARTRAHGVFLPLTLEMGSWLWVKKNPRQLFSRLGIFNPLIGHRQQRVMRRHIALLDFLSRAVASHRRWRPGDADALASHREAGLRRWYAA